MNFIAALSFDHPAFAPYRQLIDALDLARTAPSLAELNALASASGTLQARGLPLRFVTAAGHLSARDYETRILQTGEVPTRADTWHDIMNALVWLRFPRFKAALNAAHGAAIELETDVLRGRRRDALTVLDESGVWVVSRDPELPALLAGHAWQALFWERRRQVEMQMDFVVVGHALLEKLLAPYPSVTGKCLVLGQIPGSDAPAQSIEAQAVAALAAIDSPRQLAPLPVQGVPGWDAANATAAYYANPAVFRPPRLNPPAAAGRPQPATPAPSPDHRTGESPPT
ncbi:DUF3025 domain-containing protein [Thiobacillus sp.]|uniref:DUF3025 domain-containing protein n=1 Tax=Thiobacillus sp. TaxID=924 RepID=UPI0025E5BBBC|nr:DUF3025 domain-containing protein [Thiobacillus sp.]